MNNYKLDEYCADIARYIWDDIAKNGGDVTDLAHEYADGSEYVIYYAKAHDICQHCSVDAGEDFAHDVGGDTPRSYNDMASLIAYGEIQSRIMDQYWTLCQHEGEPRQGDAA